MVRRVLIGAGSLKVSKPGVDVISAGPGQLQFSSDWSQLGTVIQGTHTVTWQTSGDSGQHIVFLSFGRTFASPPAVFFDRDMGGGKWMPLGHASGFLFRIYMGTVSPGSPAYMWVLASVSTTGITVNGRYLKASSGVVIPGFSFRYRVMEYNV